MSTLAIVRVAAILIGLIWKAYHLSRRPYDWPLRAVVACLACFAVSIPLGTLTARLSDLAGLKPAVFIGLEYSLLMCAAFCIMVFFAGRERVNGVRRYLATHTTLLASGVAVTMTFAALTPPTVGPREYTNPYAAAMYLSAELYIGLALLIATWHATKIARSPDTGSVQAIGLAITTFGLLLLAVSCVLLSAVQIGTLSGLGFQATPAWFGGRGLLIGGPIFIVGICFPGAVMRARALRLWWRRLLEYHRLGPLWSLISETFPQQQLRGIGPSRQRIDSLLPRGLHRRHRRRRVEARDGLVRLSPHIPDDVLPRLDDGTREPDFRPLARWMLDNATEAGQGTGGTAKPVLVPANGASDADVRALIGLSDAIRAEEKVRGAVAPTPAKEFS